MDNKVTRVKYSLVDSKFVSTTSFLGNEGTLLKSMINPAFGIVGVYRVADDDTLTVVEEVTYHSFTKAKVVAKAMLKKYGVNFFSEVRKKRSAVC